MTTVSLEPTTNREQLFEDELLPHADALYNFAYHLTYNEADANDLVQETFMKAFRFLNSYDSGTNAKAWLFKILKNGFINEYRKKKKEPNKIDYEDVLVFQDSDEDNSAAVYDLREDVFDGMLGDEITIALNKLPIDFKTVILLCDIEGFSYEEIAKIIDIPIGTVRSRLHRARNMLKDSLRNYAIEMGFLKNE
ncbi:MAG TPA: sigma-70 family RNA polymerase sigma factor [Chitinophagales bacterium]|jgi:RNA polymerase sigma factor (sigma-70 family)|nr:sigma-70 family RNA polymerase sigma factor [Chitinophagales bacterium]MBP6153635.1 sigma-70 family RNA polymerase sigma factor [Chitinophagales bacterium]HQV77105.1 sigma-70 family RNA polymerase sigma factor [Chitinophagales bacterium]HQW77829.1 sigma-70 family RNA polymerase sigma factor [Chitinophagales bacterium]HRB19402.1 sigma-70 family RNA polymerase sigma factor [Chitinophagales bacterium]